LLGRSGALNTGSTASDRRYLRMVFRDRPVRRAIARIDRCSRKCQRRITLNNAMSNTPAAPAQKAEASVRTWVNSQWQLHPKPGQLSVAINRTAAQPYDCPYAQCHRPCCRGQAHLRLGAA
jgi:hypothetical protein